MADVVSTEVRSRMMAGIRSKDTKPELLIRQRLHRLGFRFRLHGKELPGKPDIILRKYNAVIFVHGCFWHGHRCHLFRMPGSRTDFWRQKILRNAQNDDRANRELRDHGWRIATVWECAIKGRTRLPHNEIISSLSDWLRSSDKDFELTGC